MEKKNKLIVVLGPTSAGKSDLAVRLCKKFNGEVVSADSRQVYKGMDIGSGKITKKEMRGIPHHLLDVANPKRKFTVARYQKTVQSALGKIWKKGKLPILCGGSGFYIQAVVDGIIIPKVPPNWKLRKKLGKESPEELYNMLKKLDIRRAKNIDRKNKRRLIRALEIVMKMKTPVPPFKKQPLPSRVLMIGIKKDKEKLNKLIRRRLLKRLRKGLVAEVKRLKQSSLPWKRLEEFGLEYRFVARYLQGKLNYDEMVEKLQKEIEHYAERQMTWFRKDKRIKWIKNYKEASKIVRAFLADRFYH